MRTLQILNARYPELAGRFGPPQSIPDAAERRIASISLPNRDAAVKSWLIPRAEYMGTGFVGPSGWQDAAQQGRVWSSNAAQTAVFDEAGIGGKRALVCDGSIYFMQDGAQPEGILDDKTAFSAFFVVRRNSSATGSRYLMGMADGATLARPTLLISATALSTYLGSSSGSLQAAGSYADQDLVVGVTFSTTRGVTLRRNGVQVASAPSFIAPIPDVSSTTLRLWAASASGTRFVGMAGDAIMCAADLSAPEYASQLEYIEGAWMAQYGITRGS